MPYRERRHLGRDRIVDAEIMKLELRAARERAAAARTDPAPGRGPGAG
jgi:hypothetical protein